MLTTFDARAQQQLLDLMASKHAQIAQMGKAKRTQTARQYDSSITALAAFLQDNGHTLPTKGVLVAWREAMLRGEVVSSRDGSALSISTINARLAAVRKLLREVADDVIDIQTKFALRDWASVEDAKAVIVQDKTEEDYGRRLNLKELQQYVSLIPTSNLKGLRDRAIVALGVGAGLRISEIVRLTVTDVFHTQNAEGQRGIKIRNSKHHKTRIVVLSGWNSWVMQAVQAYCDALGLPTDQPSSAAIIRGVKKVTDGYKSAGDRLSKENAAAALKDYGDLASHDLRRTFAYLCKRSGMSWDALREQLGHSSVTVTERYVGKDVDWTERIPNWSIILS